MVLPETKVKFVVGLSNGEILTENEGVLSKTDGGDSAWWKLQKHIKDNGLEIRSMSLYAKTELGNRHYHLPNEKNKFGGLVPLSYNCFRRCILDGTASPDSVAELYACAEAIYESVKVQLYVSELDPDKSWINFVQTKDE